MPEVLQLSEKWGKKLFVALEGISYPLDSKKLTTIAACCKKEILSNELFYAIVVSQNGEKQSPVPIQNGNLDELQRYLEKLQGEKAYIWFGTFPRMYD